MRDDCSRFLEDHTGLKFEIRKAEQYHSESKVSSNNVVLIKSCKECYRLPSFSYSKDLDHSKCSSLHWGNGPFLVALGFLVYGA